MPDLSLFPPSAVIDGDDLRIGGVSLRDLAREFGTPAYVLDEDGLRARSACPPCLASGTTPPR